MPVLNLLLYLSRELVSDAPTTYINYVRDALALGARHTYHYNAVPNAFKGIEPHLALCSVAVTEDAPSPPSDLTRAESPPQSPLSSPKPRPSPSTSALDAKSQPSPSFSASGGNLPNDDLPQESGDETLISWTDDDVDATDYKNMADYDPDQEESVYDSTPNPETESTASPTKKCSFDDTSYIRRYVKLDSEDNSSAGEVSANYLLLLFIPGPLNSLTLSPLSSSGPTTPGKHHTFLAHLSRYPYLTSHDNYIRHSGYVLESADPNAPAQYLIVQEFSELERRAGRKVSMDWELKRKEAKHWWRREERGASGTRVGFFKLANKEEIGQSTQE